MVRSSATTLKGKALQLLALRDYSRAEMHEKLLRWLRTQAAKQARATGHRPAATSAIAPGADQKHTPEHAFTTTHDESVHEADHDAAPAAQEQAATWLQEQSRLIPIVLDEMQAKGWLDNRRAAEALLHQRSARFGQARLRQALQQKGIDADTCQELLQEAAHSELARAQALWQKKFGTLPNTPAERAKQMRFLASRGFTAAIIQRILRHGAENDEMEWHGT